jgi:hypothetical protein
MIQESFARITSCFDLWCPCKYRNKREELQIHILATISSLLKDSSILSIGEGTAILWVTNGAHFFDRVKCGRVTLPKNARALLHVSNRFHGNKNKSCPPSKFKEETDGWQFSNCCAKPASASAGGRGH